VRRADEDGIDLDQDGRAYGACTVFDLRTAPRGDRDKGGRPAAVLPATQVRA
jgi:hypothetical protein